MSDIDKDTDKMVDSYEKKDDLWKINIKKKSDKSGNPDLESLNTILDEIEKKIDKINK